MKVFDRVKRFLGHDAGNVVIEGTMVFIVSTILLYIGLTVVDGVLTATSLPGNENSSYTVRTMLGSQGNLTNGVGSGFNLVALSPLVVGASVILGAVFAGLYIKGAM